MVNPTGFAGISGAPGTPSGPATTITPAPTVTPSAAGVPGLPGSPSGAAPTAQNVSVPGSVRAPRAYLSVGGSGNIVLESVEVHLVAGSGASSSFEAVMALDDPSNPGASFWSSCGNVGCSVYIDNGDGTGNTVFKGTMYHTEVSFGPRTVRAVGHDVTQQIIDSRSDEKWSNQTASGIVSYIAGKFGLGTVMSGSSDMAGRTYDHQDYAFLSDVQNYWDVIQELANHEGCIAFCDGVKNLLYFVNPSNISGGNYNINYVNPTMVNGGPESYDKSTVIELLCGHDCTTGEGSPTEDSWFPWDKQANVAGGGGSGSKEWYRQHAGKTQDQLERDKVARSNQLSSQEWQIEALAVGDANLTISMMVSLSGTGTAWDRSYYQTSLTHRCAVDHGYTMEIVGQNGAPS